MVYCVKYFHTAGSFDCGLEQPIANWAKCTECSSGVAEIGLAGHVLARRPRIHQHIYDHGTPGSWRPRSSLQLAFASPSSLELQFFVFVFCFSQHWCVISSSSYPLTIRLPNSSQTNEGTKKSCHGWKRGTPECKD